MYEDDDVYVIDSVDHGIDIFAKGEIHASVKIGTQEQELKIYRGAKCNVMSGELVKKLKMEHAINTEKKIRLIAYGGTSFMTLGTIEFCVNIKAKNTTLLSMLWISK